MLKNKKGFTLVELLAVIVILGVILAIAIPTVTGLIDMQKRSSFESTVRMMIRGVEYKFLENPSYSLTGKLPADFGATNADFDTASGNHWSVSRDAGTGVVSMRARGSAAGKFGTFQTGPVAGGACSSTTIAAVITFTAITVCSY